MDFTADGRALQSCCSSYEILFSDTSTGAQITDGATKLMGTEWATWTSTLGWAVQGIWTGSMDGSDINSCDRSPSGLLIATADDFGKVSCYRYPCIQPNIAQANIYTGHSSHVTCVRWMGDSNNKNKKASDRFLISTGGMDKCVFQWRNTEGSEFEKRSVTSVADLEGGRGGMGVKGREHDDLMLEGPSGGDEFTAIKPWLGAFH